MSVCLIDKQGRAGADTRPLFSVTDTAWQGQGRAARAAAAGGRATIFFRARQGGQGGHCRGPGDKFF